MKFKSSVLSLAILASTSVSAIDSTSPTWTLEKDFILNGEVVNPASQTLTHNLTSNTFSATTDAGDAAFMGRFIEPEDSAKSSMILFQEIVGDDVLRYLGEETSAGYQGTWYSTSGESGDFGLGLTADSGGSGGGINPDETSGVDVSGSNGEVVTGSIGWQSAYTGQAITSGKLYWEVKQLSGDFWISGVYNATGPHHTSKFAGVSYASNGQKWCNGNEFYNWMPIVSMGSVLSVMLDMDAKTIAFAIDGVSQGVACDSLPDAVYPGVSLYNSTSVEANFGQLPWQYPALAQ